MKAWTVTDEFCIDCGASVVFAETYGKAKTLALKYVDSFMDSEYTDLRARRFKQFDKYYKGNSIPDIWLNDEYRKILVKEFGWTCLDPCCDECKDCLAKQWCSQYLDERRYY